MANMATFSLAAIILFVVPGPAVLYIVTRSISQGRTAGLVSVLGIHSGSLVHIAAAVAGLTTLLANSATAFSIVRWTGAAYLIWLGVRAFSERERDQADFSERATAVPLRKVFTQGIVVNLLNPKTAVFFVAFVPQFIDPTRSAAPQILALGALFVLLGAASDGMYAMVAGTLGDRLGRSRGWGATRRWVSGTMYLGLGVTAALAGGDVSE